MGAGKKKANEPFAIAPTATLVHDPVEDVEAPDETTTDDALWTPTDTPPMSPELEALSSLASDHAEDLYDAPDDDGMEMPEFYASSTMSEAAPDIAYALDAVADEGAGSLQEVAQQAAAASAAAQAAADATTDQDSEPVEDQAWDQISAMEAAAAGPEGAGSMPLTPLPDSIPVGASDGLVVMTSPADLYDGAANIINYQTGEGSRQVLFADLTPQAEAKLVAALNADGTMVPVEVTEQVDKPLPIDDQHNLHGEMSTAAISINSHLKKADGIPQHTIDRVAKIEEQLKAVAMDPNSSPEQLAMAEQYGSQVVKMRAAIDNYDQVKGLDNYAGNKVPPAAQYTTVQEVTSTKLVPAENGSGGMPTEIKAATRLSTSLTDDGLSTWNGSRRAAGGGGKEYQVDLGDGYTAVYKPHGTLQNEQVADSMRGQLEIVAPKGKPVAPAEMVAQMKKLNIDNQLMTRDQGEFAYLQANTVAQRIRQTPAVQKALSEMSLVDEAMSEQVAGERMNDAIGLDQPGLDRWAKDVRLEGERRALPAKVRKLREAVAQATGYGTGDALRNSGVYNPTPTLANGYVTWNRFDVAAGKDKVAAAWKGKVLRHNVTGGDATLLGMVQSGQLSAQERRKRMGVKSGVGMSESADVNTGGARSVFLRVGSSGGGGVHLEWGKPGALVSRTDWYAYDSDNYGKKNAHGVTTDPITLAGHSGGSNEVMFSHGIDLFGPEGPTKIKTGSVQTRNQILQICKDRGITHMHGKPVSDCIK